MPFAPMAQRKSRHFPDKCPQKRRTGGTQASSSSAAVVQQESEVAPRRPRNRRRRGCRGAGRRRNGNKGDESEKPHRSPSPSPSSSSPEPRRDPPPKLCYIDREIDTDQWEAEYHDSAVLLQIAGMRPPVTAEQARLAVATQFGIQVNNQLQIHGTPPPHDFLLILPNYEAYRTVLAGDRTVHTPDFTLVLRPWNRLAYADHGALHHKVLIQLEGVPLHVWRPSVAADLLRDCCSLELVLPETRRLIGVQIHGVDD